jgi:class 3 adenylate cyclase
VRPGDGSGTATVLFTDVVGSTELLSHLGDLRYDEIRRRHFTALRQAIAAADGDEIKTMGDGVMAVFQSAVQAVGCAVAMQQDIDGQLADEAGPIEIRIGLAIGEVTFEAGDVHGTAVVEAARLVGCARGGQILATALVRAMVGSRSPARFVDVGALELKGLPEPVPACDVLWERKAGPVVPLPPLLARPQQWPLVGRADEFMALRTLWKEAAAGQRAAVFIQGEPGAGKTRLAVELGRAVHADGALVLAGRCDEEVGVPYQPFAEALRHFVDHTHDADDLALRLGRYSGDLVRLVPEVADRVAGLRPSPGSDADSERLRLFDAVASWLAKAGAEREPVLLVLDDLHWAVKPTLLMLRHLLTTTETEALLVVVTYRDSDLSSGHPLAELLADLHRVPRVERFALAGLDERGVGDFLAAADHEPGGRSVEVARTIHSETGGNPFFVGEVLRHLREYGAVGIPEGVRAMVGRRLRRLADPTYRMLRAAAVLGAEFELDTLRAMLRAEPDGFDAEAFLAGLEEAEAALLIGEVPGGAVTYRFSQTIVRATLYDELSAARRQILHGRAGAAIEEVHAGSLDACLPALAHHFDAAGPSGHPARAVDYSARAGDQALARLAFEQAVLFYDRALAGTERAAGGSGSERRGELLLCRARARAASGDQGALDDYLAAAALARERHDVDALGMAALGVADVWVASSYLSHQVQRELLEEALAGQGGATTMLRARLAARLAGELAWTPKSLDRRRQLAAESVEVARHLDDPATLAACLDSTTFAVWIHGERTRRRAAGEEIVALATRVRDPEVALKGYAWCHIASLEEGDPIALDAALDAYEACADEVGQARYLWYALTRRTMRAILTGALDEGEAMARQALASGRAQGEGDAESLYACQMSLIWQERPTNEAAEHLEMRRRSWITEPPTAALQPVTRTHAIALAVGAGQPAEIRRELDGLMDFGIANLEPSMAWTSTCAGAAIAAAQVGTEDEVAQLYELIRPASGVNAFCFGAVSYWGSLDHHLGVLAGRLGLWDQAEAHLAAAAADHQGLGARVWLTRTQLETATLLRARGRPSDVDGYRGLLAQVLATADELKLPVIAERARSATR